MTYILCKKCGCQMSDKSEACPMCGTPVGDNFENQNATNVNAENNASQKTNPVNISQTPPPPNLGNPTNINKSSQDIQTTSGNKKKTGIFVGIAIAIVAVAAIAFFFLSKSKKEKAYELNESVSVEIPISSTEDDNAESLVSTVVDARPHVYSCAYDGFVNIREQTSSKSPIVGVLRNGPEGAVLLENGGEWTKVDNNGIIGYVYSKYVQDTPTKTVDEGMDMGWLEGWWIEEEIGNISLFLFDNGTYSISNDENYKEDRTSAGTFIMENSTIVFTELIDYIGQKRVNFKWTLNVNIANRTIEGYKKMPFTKEYPQKKFEAEKKENPQKINNYNPIPF